LAGVSTNTVSSVTSNSASCGGFVSTDGGAQVIARGICWSTSPNPTADLSTKTVDGSGIGNFPSLLTGLLPSTIYYVRAYATNSVGTAYGNEVQFITLSSGALATLTTTSVTVIDDFSAVSGGLINGDGGSPVTARGLCWNTAANPTIDLVTKTNEGSGTGLFSSLMGGLTPNTLYYVRSYATNGFGTAYGNELTFLTGTASASSLQKGALIYAIPNPSEGWVRFNGLSVPGELMIRSLLGKEVMRIQIQPGIPVDLSKLAKSAYFYSVQTADGNFQGRIVLH
jgi:hypothetical protein